MARLLKQQSPINVHPLPTKENKLSLPVGSVFSKLMFAVCAFRLRQTNGSYRFPLVPFPFAEFRKHGDRDMEVWRHGHMDTWTHGGMDTQTQGHMDTWTHGHMDTWTHGHMNTWTHGHLDTWTHEHMDTWTHGHMDSWTYGNIQ